MRETKGAEQFSARDSALGYLYQVRLALLWALRRLRTTDDFRVGLETLDDVVFEEDGRPTDLLQAKHRVKRVATLSDASPDIWKTFRIWLTALAAGQIDTSTRLILVSTGLCDEDSAAFFLGHGSHRSERDALVRLNAAARSSSSEENAKGCGLFLQLSESEKLDFLTRVVIMDGAPVATSVEQELQSELRFAVPKKQISGAMDALEGWWFAQIVRQLSSPGGLTTLASRSIELKLDDIREGCQRDALLFDNELLQQQLDQATLQSFSDRTFAKQVTLVTKSPTRLNRAISDYFRAYAQRSKWLRSDLLLSADDDRFRQDLFEAWELKFARAQEAIEADSSDAKCQATGGELLAWAETDANFSLKAGVNAPWMTRGTLHELSDEMRIGWHPAYLSLLGPRGELDTEDERNE